MKEHKTCYGMLFPSAGFRQSEKERADGPFGINSSSREQFGGRRG